MEFLPFHLGKVIVELGKENFPAKSLWGGLQVPLFLKMTKEILAGIHYLHKQAHVIHRDLKPS
jgi:serine/threonine protein kinase